MFKGKQAQRMKVYETVAAKGFILRKLIKKAWFYDNLRIDDTSFHNKTMFYTLLTGYILSGLTFPPLLSQTSPHPAHTWHHSDERTLASVGPPMAHQHTAAAPAEPEGGDVTDIACERNTRACP
ncbi:hypothetical protein JB92DRAFT_3129692 [Gautieria morchelliformis]|nr:hypothetical protein JB92DRAFT_3129692 [Gautieria morchelliformis]